MKIKFSAFVGLAAAAVVVLFAGVAFAQNAAPTAPAPGQTVKHYKKILPTFRTLDAQGTKDEGKPVLTPQAAKALPRISTETEFEAIKAKVVAEARAKRDAAMKGNAAKALTAKPGAAAKQATGGDTTQPAATCEVTTLIKDKESVVPLSEWVQ